MQSIPALKKVKWCWAGKNCREYGFNCLYFSQPAPKRARGGDHWLLPPAIVFRVCYKHCKWETFFNRFFIYIDLFISYFIADFLSLYLI